MRTQLWLWATKMLVANEKDLWMGKRNFAREEYCQDEQQSFKPYFII